MPNGRPHGHVSGWASRAGIRRVAIRHGLPLVRPVRGQVVHAGRWRIACCGVPSRSDCSRTQSAGLGGGLAGVGQARRGRRPGRPHARPVAPCGQLTGAVEPGSPLAPRVPQGPNGRVCWPGRLQRFLPGRKTARGHADQPGPTFLFVADGEHRTARAETWPERRFWPKESVFGPLAKKPDK